MHEMINKKIAELMADAIEFHKCYDLASMGTTLNLVVTPQSCHIFFEFDFATIIVRFGWTWVWCFGCPLPMNLDEFDGYFFV